LIADPRLRTSVYPDVCSGIRIHPGIRPTQGIYPCLSGAGEIAAQATKSRSGAADDRSSWVADPRLRTSVHPDVCSDIRGRHGTSTTPEICPSLNAAGEVAAQAAVARGCADGGSGFITSAGSGSKRLRQTQ
jgi:hypothetical protein